jgi:hypothetical protein
MRSWRPDPSLSAWPGLHCLSYDFSAHPIHPPGQLCLAFSDPDHRDTWAPHGERETYLKRVVKEKWDEVHRLRKRRVRWTIGGGAASRCYNVSEMLQRLPDALKLAENVHVYAGIHTADLKQLVQAWFSTKKGAVQQVAPAQKEAPLPAELPILIHRTEAAPAALAQYLMTKIPFAILVPVDLLDQSNAAKVFPGTHPAVLKQKFEAAGKLTILLTTQLTWVLGNISESRRIEMFAGTMATRALITGTDRNEAQGDTFDITVSRTMEEWLEAQISNPDFESIIAGYSARDIARRDGVWVYTPEGAMPRIIVPGQQQEALIRFTHEKMFHLGAAKVAATLKKSYFWSNLAQDTRRVLDDCPNCEMEKAQTNLAHGLFAAKPHQAPRAQFAMDFQGQEMADTDECEALAIINVNVRYVHVIALKNREVETFLPAFLDEIVFRYGPRNDTFRFCTRVHVGGHDKDGRCIRDRIDNDDGPQRPIKWHCRGILEILEPLHAAPS